MSSEPPSSHNENENDSQTENQPKPVLKKALYASTKDRNHIRESFLLHRKKFVNPWRPNFDLKGAGQMGPYSRLDKYYNDIKIRKESEKNADFQNVPLEKIKAKLLNPPKNKIQVVWIGHATCLVQMHGVTILTDPIFGMRANLFESFGPKRYNPPPFTLKDLQDNDIKIDVAVVSHNHFDHLDKEAVLELKDTVMWFVPVNMKHWFAFQKTTNVVELDWWQGVKFTTDGIDAELSKQKTIPYLVVDCTQGVNDPSNPLSVPLRDDEMIICATPTQHWSKRDLADDFKYFWSSWCFITKEMRAFFGGDSGSNAGLQGHFGTADGSDPPSKFVLQAANALIDKTMALKRRQSGNDNDDTNESGEWTGADLPPPKVREEDSDDIGDDNDATQHKTVETKADADDVEHDSFYENDSHRHHHRHHVYHHKAHANEKHHEQSHDDSHDLIDQTPHHHHHKHHRRHHHRCERCAEQHDQEEMKRLEARLRVMQAFADATHPNVNVPLADYPKYKQDHPGAHDEDINQRIDNEQHPTQEDWANAIPSHFAEIGDTLGPFDLAMLPIGAYAPRDLMCCQHMCPEEAVAAHIHLRAKQSLGIHWGTFDMYTTEPVYEPPHRVNAEMMRLGLKPEEFFILRHGGVATIDANYQTSLDLSLNYEPREELPPAPSQEHDDNEDN